MSGKNHRLAFQSHNLSRFKVGNKDKLFADKNFRCGECFGYSGNNLSRYFFSEINGELKKLLRALHFLGRQNSTNLYFYFLKIIKIYHVVFVTWRCVLNKVLMYFGQN